MSIPASFKRRLAVLERLPFPPDDLELHWLGLKDIPEDELSAAVARAAKECDRFPPPKMLRAFVTERRASAPPPQTPDRATPVPERRYSLPDGTALQVSREWTYYCTVCQDSGWVNYWCGEDPTPKPWLLARTCDRRGPHGSHEFVMPCQCALTNPDVPVYVKARVRGLGLQSEKD